MKSKSTLTQFPLSSDDCELLVDFFGTKGLAELAERRRRDISVISRQIKKIAERFPVLEKNNGKWVFTPLGLEIVRWSRESMLRQQEVLASRRRICVGTTHEFGARILAANLESLMRKHPDTTFALTCADDSIESLILSGQADFGFDCGRPNSPMIRFHLVQEEPITIVASPRLIKKKRVSSLQDLLGYPFLQYARMPAHKYLELDRELSTPLAIFNSIAATRAAAVAGLGWSVLPAYAVRDEAEEGKLLKISLERKPVLEKFGVWWLRENRAIQPWVENAIEWLRERGL